MNGLSVSTLWHCTPGRPSCRASTDVAARARTPVVAGVAHRLEGAPGQPWLCEPHHSTPGSTASPRVKALACLSALPHNGPTVHALEPSARIGRFLRNPR
jgi:hypothetical protein